MRWPLRRRRPAADLSAQAAPAAPAEPARRGGRGEWRRLAPPALTASRRPPILHDGLGSLPDVAGTRSLLPRAQAIGGTLSSVATRHVADAGVLIHASRVGRPAEHPAERAEPMSLRQDPDGVIHAVREEPSGRADTGQLQGVPVRAAPVVDSPASTRQLTRATDEYVSEAREPATPYKSSEWLRRVASTRLPWQSDSDEKIAPLPPSPAPAAGRSSPAAGRSSPGAPRQVPPAERAGLGASRRRGLGPPRPGGESGQADGTPENTERGGPEQDASPAGRPRPAGVRPPDAARRPPAPPAPAPPAPVTRASVPADQPHAPGNQASAPDSHATAKAGEVPVPGGQGPVPSRQAGDLSGQPAVRAPGPPARDSGPTAFAAPAEPVQPAPEASAPALTHRPQPEPAGPRWWRKSEPERAVASVPPPLPGERARTVAGLPMDAPGTTGTPRSCGESGGEGAGQSSTQEPRRLPDAPAPGRHVPVVPERGDQRAAQAGPPELIVAPPATAAPRADAAPAPIEAATTEPAPAAPALEAEPSAGEQPRQPWQPGPSGPLAPSAPPEPPRQPLTHPASVVGRGFAPADEGGEQVTGPDALTAQALPRLAEHQPVPGMPARARYQSALDPTHPAPLIPAPQRRAAPVAPVAQVTAPSSGSRGGASTQARPYQPMTDGLATERVPAGLASAFFALHGADVSDVPVRRGRAVSQQATRLDAAAFSHGGEVYLPESAGSLGQAQAQALLAHELTHAVQQRMLGATLPGEDSAEGRELEEQAIATQRWFLGQPGPVPSLAFLPSGTVPRLTHAPVLQQASRAVADEAIGTVTAGAPAAPVSAGGGVQRQTTDAPVLTNPYAGPTSQSAQAAPAAAGASSATSAPDAVAGAAAAGTHPEIADLRDQVADLAGQRSADLDDPVHMDELAAKLYRRLRARIRHELIVDRERSGLLTDFR